MIDDMMSDKFDCWPKALNPNGYTPVAVRCPEAVNSERIAQFAYANCNPTPLSPITGTQSSARSGLIARGVMAELFSTLIV